MKTIVSDSKTFHMHKSVRRINKRTTEVKAVTSQNKNPFRTGFPKTVCATSTTTFMHLNDSLYILIMEKVLLKYVCVNQINYV